MMIQNEEVRNLVLDTDDPNEEVRNLVLHNDDPNWGGKKSSAW